MKPDAEFEVLKIFPTETELKECVCGPAANIVVTGLKYYWCLRYTLL